VNKNAASVLGRPAFASVRALPEAPDLVIVTVGPAAFEDVVDDALAGGARAIVVITAGLGETGEHGARRERAVRDRVRAAGAVLMGPNCLGIFDADAELEINGLTHGEIGLIAQSGNFALELNRLAKDHKLGFSRFASLGNQADLEIPEVVYEFAHHDSTKLIAIYCEDFRDGRAFARAAKQATDAGKAVLLLDAGRSEAGSAAAHSHTGALLSNSLAVEACCSAAGILRVDSPRELIDLAAGILSGVRVRGRKLGILTDGGYSGVVACDLAANNGFAVPVLSDPLRSALTDALSEAASTRNPVDVADAGPKDYGTYERAARLLLSSDEVDSVFLTGYFGGYSVHSEEARVAEVEVARSISRLVQATGGAMVTQSMYWDSEPAAMLQEHGIPVFRDTDAAVAVLGRLADREEVAATGIPDLLPAEPPACISTYFAARELLAAAGIDFADAGEASNLSSAKRAAATIGYPIVLKALGQLHKSEGGGVVVGIANEVELMKTFDDLVARLAPPSFSVEGMFTATHGVELLIGSRNDVRFGPVVLAGIGGRYAEVLSDVAVALAPIDQAAAVALFRALRGSTLLAGIRGGPALALQEAGRVLSALSRVAASHPEIAELEINPLYVTPFGATGLDARMLLRGG
jgi:acyl-CoA synthetase (NDP forming)